MHRNTKSARLFAVCKRTFSWLERWSRDPEVLEVAFFRNWSRFESENVCIYDTLIFPTP